MLDPQVIDRATHGRVLAGRYELGSVVGRGGMAEVRMAHDRVLQRDVAVKLLWEALAGDPRFAARLRREARAAASVSHPGLVSVFDWGEDAGRPYLVMELVPGRTVAELLWQEGSQPPARAVAIARDAAKALDAAHRAGLVHRDVKPGNLMVTPDGALKVLDLGLAEAASWTPLTAGADAQGTPAYLSPEQARGGPVDARSDVYALGVVLYELLTGRPPFSGGAPVAIAYRHLHEEPRPPGELRPQIPAALEAIVLRCLEKEPERRFQTARQLARALGEVQDAAVAGPVTPAVESARTRELPIVPADLPDAAAPARRPRRVRRRVVTGLLAVSAVITAGLGAASLARGRTPTVTTSPPEHVPSPLLAPTSVEAEAACDGFLSARVDLAWVADPDGAADGFAIYRRDDSSPFHRLAVVAGGGRMTYRDDTVGSNATYTYVVRAMHGERVSARSPAAEADTPFFCAW
jgi:serine/threonine-protein kinase